MESLRIDSINQKAKRVTKELADMELIVSPLATPSCLAMPVMLVLPYAKKEIYQRTDVYPDPKMGERYDDSETICSGTWVQQKHFRFYRH
jgi:hypothetical protein